MNITSPKEMELEEGLLEKTVEEFEQMLTLYEKGYPAYSLVINRVTPTPICWEISSMYRKAGWSKKTKCTSDKDLNITTLELWR